jgi:hypothetical protein
MLRSRGEGNPTLASGSSRAEETVWGYGAELKDPSGYRTRLWDKAMMQEKG